MKERGEMRRRNQSFFIRKMVVAISDNWPNMQMEGLFPKLDIVTQNDHSN